MNEMNATNIMNEFGNGISCAAKLPAATTFTFSPGDVATIDIPGNIGCFGSSFIDNFVDRSIGEAINIGSANAIPGVDENTKNIVKFEDGIVGSTTILNENVRHENKCVMPDIEDVEFVEKNGLIKVVIVYFCDGSTEKAVLADGDQFSIENAITVCIAKKLLSDKTFGSGGAVYNKIIHHALNGIKKRAAEEKKYNDEEEARIARFEKMKQKKAAKKAKREAAEREREISIQAEAYARALKMVSGTNTL